MTDAILDLISKHQASMQKILDIINKQHESLARQQRDTAIKIQTIIDIRREIEELIKGESK
jgi:uncharacterized protein YqgV (UPF0045/DUF77 family)